MKETSLKSIMFAGAQMGILSTGKSTSSCILIIRSYYFVKVAELNLGHGGKKPVMYVIDVAVSVITLKFSFINRCYLTHNISKILCSTVNQFDGESMPVILPLDDSKVSDAFHNGTLYRTCLFTFPFSPVC